ncbi:MAG: hypothetical protein AAF387_04835 [Pseudomonadota bacterium]
MRTPFFFIALFSFYGFIEPASGQLSFHSAPEGDHFVFVPEKAPNLVQVIAHGSILKGKSATETAEVYITRWVSYAEKYGLLIIAPVFDTPRFGNKKGGYGGYRNLFGREIAADEFVLDLVARYQRNHAIPSLKFLLYGHSAGGQFAIRFSVTHPQQLIKTVVSAPGRYSYPNTLVPWPYGAGQLEKKIVWQNGQSNEITVKPKLRNYAEAAGLISVVVGALDLAPQPKRPAHVGDTRIELAHSWAAAMQENARTYERPASNNVTVVPGVGHSSKNLTRHSAKVLFADLTPLN